MARVFNTPELERGLPNGPNLDKDSSQIVVCPEQEAGIRSCVSVSLVDAYVVIAT